ncbi:MAG: outer membrane protein assembly factor BamD [Bacteroidales bacterium]|jgi:outer membrane protein assembly factor BamD|nr:outer membrane protein assembly factor BamD [Bacteroidales bacterium]
MKKFFVGLIIIITAFSSCSQYEKLRKSTNYQLKYKMAFLYYEKSDFVRSAQLFDDIVGIYSGTNKADTVSYYQAMSYFKQKDYLTASHYFTKLFKTHPQSPFAEECEFLSGYCYYKQSPRPELDQEMTFAAIESFQMFLIRHPNSKYKDECLQYIGEMQDKLVDKSYIAAKLYYNLSQYKASIVALNNSLNDYPDTKYREELMYLLLRSSYLLAENSVIEKQKERYQSAVDEYYSFIGEFPDSNYARDAQRMYERSDRYLKAKGEDDPDEDEYIETKE